MPPTRSSSDTTLGDSHPAGGRAPLSSSRPIPPSIGPYAILGVLGFGGMGVVYRGTHGETGAPVAVKTVRASDGAAVSGIRREIHALGRLRHPGIVRIVDEGISDGLPWYAMQLLEGRTLRSFIRDAWRGHAPGGAFTTLELSAPLSDSPTADVDAGREPRRDAAPSAVGQGADALLSLVRRLCAPLGYLHGAGLVHRDLKPENVFVHADGRPVLVDLGIAARFAGARGREALEADVEVMGSTSYMAPEQIRGELVDARADLYALGCILYECVTGGPPFGQDKGTSLLLQHLRDAPVPPSQRVPGIPEALDRLVLKLLEKRPQDRLGYADDVAAALAALGAEGQDGGEPESRTRAYVYRPDLVGRTEAMAPLDAALRRLEQSGRGGLLLVRGESGVGKTRLSMEMARAAAQRGLTVITGECAALAAFDARRADERRPEPTAGAAPLRALRPLLLSLADDARRGGPAETMRLLGPRAKVLAAYEPSMAHLPGIDALLDPPVLPADAARARVIDALRGALFALAEREPVVVVLDDLQWADELLYSFLAALVASRLEGRPVLVVGTYRMEETRPELASLSAMPDVTSITLERLDAPCVRAMVSGMLALADPPTALVDFVASRSSGNPFFVAEYLHAAIDEGVLARDGVGRWRWIPPGTAADALAALPLPEVLAELFDRRLGGLDAGGRELLGWAAVLGRELDADLLASADDTRAMEAIESLRVRQILEEAPGGRLRFVHDKIREMAYERIGPPERRDLHRRAAGVLEARAGGDPDAAAAIGHHFALGGVHDRASVHLAVAADRARHKYANGEAIASYRGAIGEGRAAREAGVPEAELPALAVLYERLGEVLLLVGQREPAREALAQALAEVPAELRVERGRLLATLAKTWETEHRHAEALRVYGEAEAALGPCEDEASATWWNTWIALQVDRVWVHYWLADLDGMTACVERARPEVERRGTPAQRSRFFQALVHGDLRRERYAISEGSVRLMRASLEAAEQTGDEGAVAYARFVLGFTLVFSGALDEAGPTLREALASARRTGDVALQARCLTYLTLQGRLSGDVAETRALAGEALGVAEALGMHDYLGVAHANLGWAAWHEGDPAEAARETDQALAHWALLSPKFAYPLQWMARLTGIALGLDRGAVDDAVAHARLLRDPPQHKLPAAVLGPIEEATAAAEGGDADGAAGALRRALSAAARTERGRFW